MTGTVTVCGLGPGAPGALTVVTKAALAGPDPVFLRTRRHPTSDEAIAAESFDHLYQRLDSFDQIYQAIADALVAAADQHGRAVYAVPGSPLVLERTVRHLQAMAAESELEVELLPAVSFLDEAWAQLGIDPVDDGVRLIDGVRFATEAAGERGPLLVAHAHSNWVLSDIKLAIDAGEEQRAIVLQSLGTEDQRIFEVAWPDLDRLVEADHLTSLFLPEVAAPVGHQLARSIEMMHRLRRDCPWDQAQDHRSLRRFLLEEAFEVVEAIDRLPEPRDGDDTDQPEPAAAAFIDLEEELGDLWFQILFHSELAAERGWFTLADVAQTLTDKMIERHPHVYGEAGPEAASVGEWERVKQAQKSRDSAMDDIPVAFPALARADKVLKRAAGAGASGEFGDLAAAARQLIPASSTSEEVGLALLATVDQARHLGINAEEALRQATARAVERFRQAEAGGLADHRWVHG